MRRINATLKRATEIIDEAVAQAEKYNVPRAATLSLLVKAEGLFDDMAQYGRPTPELRYRKAWMLIQFAHSYAILGDTTRQLARADGALCPCILSANGLSTIWRKKKNTALRARKTCDPSAKRPASATSTFPRS